MVFDLGRLVGQFYPSLALFGQLGLGIGLVVHTCLVGLACRKVAVDQSALGRPFLVAGQGIGLELGIDLVVGLELGIGLVVGLELGIDLVAGQGIGLVVGLELGIGLVVGLELGIGLVVGLELGIDLVAG